MKNIITSALISSVMIITGCAENSYTAAPAKTGTDASSGNENISADDEKVPADDKKVSADDEKVSTSLELVRKMGNGINLGNTLEAYGHKNYVNGADPDGFEKLWGQPYTTAEMFTDMKSLGFDTVRIPVAWTNGINYESGDYKIDERLMSRVETVVNYALDADLYVIINDHWDGSWWGMFGSDDKKTQQMAMELYTSMWTQISERFKNASCRLIFESANEELGDRLNDSDVTGTKGVLDQDACYKKTNEINAEFVKTVRAAGGKNSERFLLIAGYNTDIMKTCDDRFRMPDDTAQNKLLLSVHYYTPWDYCGDDSRKTWGLKRDYALQNRLFEMLDKFTADGVGVVIGEYAVMPKDGGVKDNTLDFYSNLLDNCDLHDCCPVLWDCSGFYKRATRTTSDKDIAALFNSRRYANEKDKSAEKIKEDAKKRLEDTLAKAK